MPQLNLISSANSNHLNNQSPDSDIKTIDLDLTAVNEKLKNATSIQVVEWAAENFPQTLVMSTSFGIQAAVMLHLAVSVIPDIPVIWIDTGYLPPETYKFAQQLTERLNLNLKVYQSPLSPARM